MARLKIGTRVQTGTRAGQHVETGRIARRSRGDTALALGGDWYNVRYDADGRVGCLKLGDHFRVTDNR